MAIWATSPLSSEKRTRTWTWTRRRETGLAIVVFLVFAVGIIVIGAFIFDIRNTLSSSANYFQRQKSLIRRRINFPNNESSTSWNNDNSSDLEMVSLLEGDAQF